MPKKTTKGTIVSEIFAARAVFNLPPPSAKDPSGTIDFLVAAHHKVGAQDFGAQIERQPRTIQLAQVRDVTVKLSTGKSISGAELVEAVQELFEALHTGVAAATEPSPTDMTPPPAKKRASARKRK